MITSRLSPPFRATFKQVANHNHWTMFLIKWTANVGGNEVDAGGKLFKTSSSVGEKAREGILSAKGFDLSSMVVGAARVCSASRVDGHERDDIVLLLLECCRRRDFGGDLHPVEVRGCRRNGEVVIGLTWLAI